jgi:hypothetical protein
MARFRAKFQWIYGSVDVARLDPMTTKIQVLGILGRALNDAFKSHSL